MTKAVTTTDHTVIKQWAESRKGHPAFVRATENKKRGGGLLRIDFGKPEPSLHEVSWDDFFETFDQNELAFLYQDRTASGRKSRFCKFVGRETIDTSDSEDDKPNGSSRTASASASSAAPKKSSGAKKKTARKDEDEEEDLDEDDDFDDDDEDDDED